MISDICIKLVCRKENNTGNLIDGDALVDFVSAGEDTEDLFNSIVIEVVKNAVQKMSVAEAIPITWIEAEIKKLRGMNFEFATITAGQIEAMLNKWRKEARKGDMND